MGLCPFCPQNFAHMTPSFQVGLAPLPPNQKLLIGYHAIALFFVLFCFVLFCFAGTEV
jgi:hypothetical protein